MKRILLIQPPLEDFYTTPIRLYPLGLLYAASVLKVMGFQVEILDCLKPLRKKQLPLPQKFSYLKQHLGQPLFFKSFQRFGMTTEQVLTRVGENCPDLIAINSSFAAYFSTAAELVRELKKKFRVPVVVGGNQATCCRDEIKTRVPEIDYILAGPAESCLPRFIGENSLANARQEIISFQPLDWKKLRPAHELLEPSSYRIGKKNYLSLQASRGCPQNCSFCNIHLVFGRRMDYRTVSSVLEEMRWNYRYRGVRLFNFEDDNLAFDRGWLVEFLEAVATDPELERCELTFMNGLGYENLDGDLLELMKRAGVRKLDLSWVSGNADVRQRYHRPQKKDEAEFFDLLKMARRLGFFVTVYLILGLPGQSREEIVNTSEKLLEAGVLVGPSVFYLTPGSELQRNLKLPLEIAGDWDLYRSTAFAVETEELRRRDLIELFLYIRKRNLENRTRVFRVSTS
ncbi:MAG: B12-binding domain-containing radical SAM protein [Candidatus Saccharicenans sp.]|nr:B12-binding domain-containing radical SAM protein [Candidatus Saccharicenans sp.]